MLFLSFFPFLVSVRLDLPPSLPSSLLSSAKIRFSSPDFCTKRRNGYFATPILRIFFSPSPAFSKGFFRLQQMRKFSSSWKAK